MRPGAPRSSGARRVWRARSARCTTARACSTSRPSPPASACRRGHSALSLCPASVLVVECRGLAAGAPRALPSSKGAPGAAGSWQRRSHWWRRCRARSAAATPCAATWTRSPPWPPRRVTPLPAAQHAAPALRACRGLRRRGAAPGEDVRAGGAVAEDVDYFDAADLGGLRRRLRRAIEDKQREQELYLEIVARYLQARPAARRSTWRYPSLALYPCGCPGAQVSDILANQGRWGRPFASTTHAELPAALAHAEWWWKCVLRAWAFRCGPARARTVRPRGAHGSRAAAQSAGARARAGGPPLCARRSAWRSLSRRSPSATGCPTCPCLQPRCTPPPATRRRSSCSRSRSWCRPRRRCRCMLAAVAARWPQPTRCCGGIGWDRVGGTRPNPGGP